MVLLDRTVATLGAMDRVIEVLRDNLPAATTAAGVETGLTLPTLRDQDILLGDHPDMVPGKLTQVRVADPDHRPGDGLNRGEDRGTTAVKVRLYVAAQSRVAVGGVTDASLLPTLERVSAAMTGAIISTLEAMLPNSVYISIQINRARALTRPPRQRVNRILVKCTELDVTINLRHRNSAGQTTG